MGEKLGGRIQERKLDTSAIESVGTFIYCISTQRHLFLLRNSSKYAGSWGLSGGRIEQGELISSSLYRELREELGVDLSDSKIIPIEKFTTENNNFSYHTFLLPVEEEFVPNLNHEHRGYCWVALKDHPKPLHPGVWRTVNFSEIVDKISVLENLLKI